MTSPFDFDNIDSDTFFIVRKLIWEHSDIGMSFKCLDPYYFIVFEDIIFRYIIFRDP